MISLQQCVAILLFSFLLVFSLACSEGDTNNPQVKIISWRCERKEIMVICALKARKNAPGDFNGLFHPEYKDESGNIVSTCEKCNQSNNSQSDSDDEMMNKLMVFSVPPDSTLFHILAIIPVAPKIKKYKFQFTDVTSNRIISNTVEGMVFEPE